MKAIKLMPMTMRSIVIGNALDDLRSAVHGMPMMVYMGTSYAIIAAAEACAAGVRENALATALAGETVYGTAVIIGINNKAWCDVSEGTTETIKEMYAARRKYNVPGKN